MKSPRIVTAVGILGVILAGAMLLPRSGETPPSVATPPTIHVTRQVAKSNDRGPVAEPKGDPVGKDAELPEQERVAILNTIEQASVTYSSAALPLIEPFLLHPDPEVRLAAMNGMIVLGEAAAGPLLRKAAGNSKNPKEAVALAEAADFVELPSGTFVPMDRTSKGTRKPLEGEAGRRTRQLAPPAKPTEDSAPPGE